MEAVKIQPPVVHTTVPRHLGSSGNGGGCALRQGRPMEIPPPPAREHTASLPATSPRAAQATPGTQSREEAGPCNCRTLGVFWEALLGAPATPAAALGPPFLAVPRGPSRNWGGGQGAGRGEAGADSPMHVRPSECREYFWWQPHVGPVSVSSQLCWQPPFP